MQNERPKVGVAAIIVKGNKVLLGKRKNVLGGGSWCFPGGHLEHNEEIHECAKREVMEEAGIEITNIKFSTITNDIFKEEGKHYITIFMLAEHYSGEVRVMEPHKCEKWEWFEWDKLPEPLFVPIQNLLKQDYKQDYKPF